MFWFTLFLFIGFTVLGELLRPRPKIDTPKPSALGDFTIPTADASRAVPVIFGTVLTRGPNCVWYGDLHVVPIKKKISTGLFTSTTITTGYRYFLGMDLVLCHGTVDVFRGIRFEDKVPITTTAPVGDHLQIDLDAGAVIHFFFTSYPNRYLFGGDDQGGGVGGKVDFYYGLGAQTRNDYLAAATGYANISGYPTVSHAVFRGIYWGTSAYIKYPAFELSRYPNTLGLLSGHHIISTYDCNPACALYEILTDPVWGLGIATGAIDLASFQAAGETLFGEDLGLSFQLDSPAAARDQVSELLRHIDGVMFTDPYSGKLTLTLARKDYTVGLLPVFDKTNVDDVELSRPSWSELTNDIRIAFLSRLNNYTQVPAQWQNLAGIQIRGRRYTETIDFLMVSRASVANALVARVGKTLTYPLARVRVTANRSAWQMKPGSVFVLNWAPLNIAGMVLRVINPDYGDLEDGTISLECVEDIFSVASTAYSPPGTSGWVDPVGAPAAPTAQTLLEGPFHLIGSADRHVLTAAVRSSGADLGYDIFSDRTGGTAYERTNVAQGFTPSGRLAGFYAASTSALDAAGFVLNTTVDLLSLDALTTDELYAGVQLCLIDSEILAVQTPTDNGDGTWTFTNVLRGVLDTVPAAHSAGARVWFLLPGGCAVVEPANPYPADGNVRVKLCPFNNRGVLDLSAASAILIATASRAQKPYPPGNVKLNGTPWPTTIAGGFDLVVTWAHRHRVQQFVDLKVVAQDAGNYVATPEGDYTVEIRVGGVLKRTASAIAGTTYTWLAADQATDGAVFGAAISIRVIPKNGALVGTYQERLFSIS